MSWFSKAVKWVDKKLTQAGEWIDKQVDKAKKHFKENKTPPTEIFTHCPPPHVGGDGPITNSPSNNLHNKVSDYQARQKVHIDQYEEKIKVVFKDLYEPVTMSLKSLNNEGNIIDIQKVADKVIEKSKTFEKVMTYHINERINENDTEFLNVYLKSDFEINEFCKKVVTESEKKFFNILMPL